jgi:hypothetical protein
VFVLNFVFIVFIYVVGVSIDEVHSFLHSITLIESFSSSVEIGVWVWSFFVTSTFHFITSTSVPFVGLWLTAKIVHLTAAVESVVCISNSLWSFRLVALVQIVSVSPYIGAVFGDGGGV